MDEWEKLHNYLREMEDQTRVVIGLKRAALLHPEKKKQLTEAKEDLQAVASRFQRDLSEMFHTKGLCP